MNSNDTHSQQYTSPLKYFEYLASELKIVGTNFPSHKALPYSEQIEFFEYGNEKSLKEAIKASSEVSKPQLLNSPATPSEILRVLKA